jgi:hypothetical protein
MLPSAIPNARILRYGYNSKWWGHEPIKSRVQDMAADLLHHLKNEAERAVSASFLIADQFNSFKQQHPQRPLIFICHCFGGLIVEKVRVLHVTYAIYKY